MASKEVLDIDGAILFSLKERNLNFTLKNEQRQCISSVLQGNDTLAVLPTGYGKSLIFQLLPHAFDYLIRDESSIILVVSPLNALMEEQIKKLNDEGIPACMIKGNTVVSDKEDPLSRIKKPSPFKLIYFHPEVCVNSKQFLAMMKSPEYQKTVRCIVTDEAHLVIEWVSFRPSYGKLDIMANLFPNIPHLALTATATKKTRDEIKEVLQLRDPLVVQISPDRRNIFFGARERPARGSNKLGPILNPVIEKLRQEKDNMEITLIYGNLETCAECFITFSSALGEEQYSPIGAEPIAQNRLFAQYHAEYPTHEKERLVNEMINGTCKARVLFVTIAFGMGIDIPNIRRVIHIGVPHTMEEYFQEAGRGGRDGAPATATLFYNSYDIMKRKNGIDDVMREFATTKGCRRKVIMGYFGYELSSYTPHDCCDNDKNACDCSECLLSMMEQVEKMAFESTEELDKRPTEPETKTPPKPTVFTEADKDKIRVELENYRTSLCKGKSCVGGITLSSGFSLELIDEAVKHCDELTSIEIIQDTLPVFSKRNAEVIFNVLSKYTPK